jgi:hypothetical protein
MKPAMENRQRTVLPDGLHGQGIFAGLSAERRFRDAFHGIGRVVVRRRTLRAERLAGIRPGSRAFDPGLLQLLTGDARIVLC